MPQLSSVLHGALCCTHALGAQPGRSKEQAWSAQSPLCSGGAKDIPNPLAAMNVTTGTGVLGGSRAFGSAFTSLGAPLAQCSLRSA